MNDIQVDKLWRLLDLFNKTLMTVLEGYGQVLENMKLIPFSFYLKNQA